MLVYENFTEAYVDLCRLIRDESDFVSFPRGLKIKEKLGVQFRIKNPRDRLPYIKARNFSVSYFVAESLWYLSGSNSTKWISNYAPFWKGISDDGETANSAYGARIFKHHPRIAGGELNQWDYIKSELTKDPESRRAVIHIRTPEDSLYAVKDVPCTLALQFFIRDGLLHLHVNMRSSDIILGIAYDVPAFTLMQEILANELGVGLGEYVHTSNSLHCYSDRDANMLDAIASSDNKSYGQMPKLPREFPTKELMKFENLLVNCSKGEFLDGIMFFDKNEFSDESSKNIFEDWSKILCSAKARKMKLSEASISYLRAANFNGYHFFNR